MDVFVQGLVWLGVLFCLDGFAVHFQKQIHRFLSRSPSSALSHPFFGLEGSPTKIDYKKVGTLILSAPLEDLVVPQKGRN